MSELNHEELERMSKSKALTKANGKKNGNGHKVTALTEAPDFLPAKMKVTGTEALDREDFKTPRIVLLQGLSPQLEVYEGVAKKDQFFHTGMNINLGREFSFVPVIVSKRVILWKPRLDGGGILAMSMDGKTWTSGGNTEFEIKLGKQKVKWHTKESVLASGLTRFGSSDPDDPRSQPAASIVYEYLVYLPDHPELSPCVLGLSKTGVTNAKQFNTSLYMQARQGRPTYALMARCFTEEEANEKGKWTVPAFELQGFVPDKAMFEECKRMAETLGDYQPEYVQEEVTTTVDDSIAY